MALAETLLAPPLPEESVRRRQQEIHRQALAQSRYLVAANFALIHPDDLAALYGAYDDRFFGGAIAQALAGRKLDFRLAPRMTRTGGTTTRYRSRETGQISYEIAIAIGMLFDSFREADRAVTVCGVECGDRLQALQRILEHELVHLSEQLCWDVSDCRAPRFQEIAGRLFLHRSHTHSLITRHERAVNAGIHCGSRVAFLFEGRRLIGRVNRITKRATVLVEDAAGTLHSDGQRYKIYYVPLSGLEPVA